MDYKTLKTFVNEKEYSWITYKGEPYYVRPDDAEDDWIVHLLIHKNSDVNDWSYAITSKVSEFDEYGDPTGILEPYDIQEPEEVA